MQNYSMHIILNCDPRTHISGMVSELKCLSELQWIIFLTVVMIFKIKNQQPQITRLSDWFTYPTHQYPTRSSTCGDLYVSKANPQFFISNGTRHCNMLPSTIRELANIKSFKKASTY